MSLKKTELDGSFLVRTSRRTLFITSQDQLLLGRFFSVSFLGGLWLEPIAIKDFLTRHVQSIHASGSRSRPSRRNLNIVPTKLSNSTVNRTARL